MGLELPKQFLKVAGATVLEHTVSVFQAHADIAEICIVVAPEFAPLVEDMVIRNSWTKVKKILMGGPDRSSSTLSAIRAYGSDLDMNLIIHDAVRPLVSSRIIEDVIVALTSHVAVDTAVPSADTIIRVSREGNGIVEIPQRKYLLRGQTPQGFRLATLREAYDLALQDESFEATDDCGVVVKYLPGTTVHVVPGDESNIKLTRPEDVYLLEKLFQVRTSRATLGLSSQAVADKVAVVVGGSSGIGLELVSVFREYGGVPYDLSRRTNGVDIRDSIAIRRALADIYSDAGRIDYVVCTAGVLVREPLKHMGPQAIDDSIDVNFRGAINVSLASLEYLQASGGQLLHFTSSSYTRGRAYYSIYSATKAAVVNFVQAIAEEWATFGIRVNCLNPERTRTPMREANFGVEPDDTLLSPRVVAEAAVNVLLSPYTGQVIDVKLADRPRAASE